MKVSVFQTAKGCSGILVPQNQITMEHAGPGWGTVTVYPEFGFQELEGLGGALTEAACRTMMQMAPETRHEVLKSYFAPEGGCGYDIIRLHMNSCDFSLENYSCDDVEGDYELRHFSIERDRKWVIPVLKEALALKKNLKVFFSPWSPPAWMKNNHCMNGGGHLLPECRKSWALFFCKYIEALREEGIEVWGFSVNNEPGWTPWDSLELSAFEERDFIRDYLGPMLAERGHSHIKIMIHDHARDNVFQRSYITYQDPEASKYVWGAAFHWYGDNCYENVSLLHDAFPEKKLFFSEGCNGGNNYGDPEWGDADVKDPAGLYLHKGVWEAGERYARNMIQDFNHHTCGWLDWNVVVNETGGPRHLPNGCGAPYIYDTQKHILERTESFAYLAHFFRFLKAGARRIAAVSNKQNLECTAFRNPDGNVVLIILNRTENAIPFACNLGEYSAQAEMPPRSIQTWVMIPDVCFM